MTDALLALLVVVPILAAIVPLLAGLRYRNVGWGIAAVVTVAELAIATVVAWVVFVEGWFAHPLVGFPRQYGIELVADELSAAVVLFTVLAAVAMLVFSRRAGPRGNTFYSGYLLLLGGLMGLLLTGDMFNMFVFLEIVGLTTYAMVAADRSGKSAYAALKYLFLGTIGASLYLVGVGYVYVATGTLNMIELQTALAEVGYTDVRVLAAYGMVFAGLALKIAVFPLHSWQPDAYSRAPDSVTVFISAVVSTSAAYALIRITYTAFTADFLLANPLMQELMLAAAGVSIVAGSALAVAQTELKRMFAYSSVAQFGMIIAAVALVNETALLGGIVHLLGHGLLKGALFLAVGMLTLGYGVRTVSDLSGLGDRAPITSMALVLLGLALVGIPPSIGFIGKWYIAVGAVEAGSWGIAGVIFLSTLLTLTYVARIGEQLYFDSHMGETASTDHGGDPSGIGHEDESTGPGHDVATDGGATGTADATDDGKPITTGMVLVLVIATLLAIALGFAGIAFHELFEPLLGRVFA